MADLTAARKAATTVRSTVDEKGLSLVDNLAERTVLIAVVSTVAWTDKSMVVSMVDPMELQ